MNICLDARRLRLALPSLALLCGLTVAPAAGAAETATVATTVTAGPAWIREVPPSSPVAAAFLTLTNSGGQPLRLIAIESPLADKVHWHDMIREGGVLRMKVQRKVILPAHGRIELAPGGGHLMLLGLRQPLAPGMKVPLTLRFSNRQTVSVTAVVRSADADTGAAGGASAGTAGGGHGHHH